MKNKTSKKSSNVKRPPVKLVGEDGNVFNVIGSCKRALLKAGQTKEAEEFLYKAFHARDYNDVLGLAMKYCDVR